MKLEAVVCPFEAAAEADPPPQMEKIRSAIEAGTPSPRISRRKTFRLTEFAPGEDSLRNASWSLRRSASVTVTGKISVKRRIFVSSVPTIAINYGLGPCAVI